MTFNPAYPGRIPVKEDIVPIKFLDFDIPDYIDIYCGQLQMKGFKENKHRNDSLSK